MRNYSHPPTFSFSPFFTKLWNLLSLQNPVGGGAKKYKLSLEISSTWKLWWLALIYLLLFFNSLSLSLFQLLPKIKKHKISFSSPRLSIGYPSSKGINGCLARCFASFVRRNVLREYRFQLLLFFIRFGGNGEERLVSIKEILFSPRSRCLKFKKEWEREKVAGIKVAIWLFDVLYSILRPVFSKFQSQLSQRNNRVE